MLQINNNTYISVVKTFQATLCITVFAFIVLFIVQFEAFQSFPETLAVAEHQALQLLLGSILLEITVGYKLDVRACIGFFLRWGCRLLDGLFVFLGGFRLL